MNVPCIQDRVAMALASNGSAKAAVRDCINMLPEGDYRRGVMFYVLKVLNDCHDDYERVLKALEECE